MSVDQDIEEPVQQPPVAPRKPRTYVEESSDYLLLSCRNRQWGGSLFLLIWLTGWTVGCVFLAGLALQKRDGFTLLFAIPFWASWFFVAAMVCKMLFQLEQLLLSPAGLFYVRKVFFPIHRRTVPLKEIKGVELYTTVVDSENNRTEQGIEVVTLGKPLRCWQNLSSDELDWLRYQLRNKLADLRDSNEPADIAPAIHALAAGEATSAAGLMANAAMAEEELDGPPSDCSWIRDDPTIQQICFTKRGQLSISGILGIGFVMLFWNSIVIVFIFSLLGWMPDNKAPQGGEWWKLFFFLIPFELIGLLFLVAFLAAALAPLNRVVWTFFEESIAYSNTWAGIGVRRLWPVQDLARIDRRQKR